MSHPVSGTSTAAPDSPANCVVLVPAYSHIEPGCEAGLRVLESRGYMVRRYFGSSQIDYVRSMLATQALDEGFEELMWIDADIAFDPDFVDRLRRHHLPVVTGLYVKKGQRDLAFEMLPETQRVLFGQHGGLLPIQRAVAGFLLTRRCVFEAVQKHFALPRCNTAPHRQPALVPWFLPMLVPDGDRGGNGDRDGNGQLYLGEDFAFSERVRRCGFEIVADTTRRLHHIGPYGFSWEDAGNGTQRYESYTYQIHSTPSA